MRIRLYKIWGSGLGIDGDDTMMYIWGKDSDDAFFGVARKIDPKVTAHQWTGIEKDWEVEDRCQGKN